MKKRVQPFKYRVVFKNQAGEAVARKDHGQKREAIRIAKRGLGGSPRQQTNYYHADVYDFLGKLVFQAHWDSQEQRVMIEEL